MANIRSSKRLQFIRETNFGDSTPICHGYIFNLSKGGIAIKTYKPLFAGTKIIAEILLLGENIRLEGTVKWVSFSPIEVIPQMGIKITSNPEKIKDIYSKLAS